MILEFNEVNNIYRCSLGLIGHPKHLPTMYGLYCVLKGRTEPPTAEEIGFTSGKKVLDTKKFPSILKNSRPPQRTFRSHRKTLQYVSLFSFLAGTISNSVNQGPWDQAKFERLFAEWIVACDQPFDEVDKEFVKLMTYARHPAPSVKCPSREGIRRRVITMGDDTIAGIREMFEAGVIWYSMILLTYYYIESRRKSCFIPRCMDFKEPIRILGNRRTLCG